MNALMASLAGSIPSQATAIVSDLLPIAALLGGIALAFGVLRAALSMVRG